MLYFQLLPPRLKFAGCPSAVKRHHQVIEIAAVSETDRLAFKHTGDLQGAEGISKRIQAAANMPSRVNIAA